MKHAPWGKTTSTAGTPRAGGLLAGALGFLTGAGLFQFLPALPPTSGLVAGLGLVCAVLLWRMVGARRLQPWPGLPMRLGARLGVRLGTPLLALAIGWLWAHGYALWRLPAAPPPTAWLQQPLAVEGRIAALVERQARRDRFQLRISRICPPGQGLTPAAASAADPGAGTMAASSGTGAEGAGVAASSSAPIMAPALAPDGCLRGNWLARLSWYNERPTLQPGQRWQLRVKFKPAHGFRNPGGFDREAWLRRQGIGLVGYVREALDGPLATPGHAASPARVLAQWRQTLSDGLAQVLADHPAQGVVRALVVGDRSGIPWAQRDVFRATGTSHLMAISGLHIGLVAGLAGWLAAGLWRRLPAASARLPAAHAGVLVALVAGLGYALLAGFTLPTQRAFLMLALAAAALLALRACRTSGVLALVLVAVVALEPPALLGASLWLSFGAVALIFYTLSGARRRWPWWRRVLTLQLGLSVGLTPVLLLFGLPLAPFGVPANLLAVPWFGLLVVPASLLGGLGWVLGLPGAVWLLEVAAELAIWGVTLLEWLAALVPAGLGLPPPGPLAVLLAILGLAVLFAPGGLPARWLGAVLLLPMLTTPWPRQTLAPGDFRLTLLDVGQGLAAVVQTRERVLVYDTGPGYPSGFETGSVVVAPYLRRQGWGQIDRLMVSHADRDHAGGVAGLLGELPAREVLSGEPLRAQDGVTSRPCVAGTQWDWEGVHFALLHPPAGAELRGNDASCVLRVANAAGSALLTGDIEAAVERRLVAAGALPPTSVVVAPHHGSASSSTPALIAATAPDHVIYTAGFFNRFGFPVAAVQARWREAGARALDTAEVGAITLHFDAAGGPPQIRAERQAHRRYWHRNP